MKVLPVLFVLAVLCIGSLAGSAAAAPVELLTSAEAMQPNLPMGKDGQPTEGRIARTESRTTPLPGAPQIVVDMPLPGIGVTAPFPVKIRFIPAAGAKINVDSLKVDVLKMVPISLLSRVKPYLTPTGINVPEAKIPAGTYNLRIVVADDQGREGSTLQTWTVH